MNPSFKQLLASYADTVIRVGLNVQPGQRVIIRHAPLETASFVRELARAAYLARARLVDVMWTDEKLSKIRLQHALQNSLAEFPTWRADALVAAAKSGDAVLSIHAVDPDLLSKEEPERVSVVQKAADRHMHEYSSYVMNNALNWCVVSAATTPWAAKLFPNIPRADQLRKLWHAIFSASHIFEENPIGAWQEHIGRLTVIQNALNKKQYVSLRLTGANTDLLIGLAETNTWVAADSVTSTPAAISFVANMPTEEVFTIPHKDRAEGYVSSSKPLNYAGRVIRDFTLTVREGRVVKAEAKEGQETLRRLLETDEGASRFGEIALVPHSSPISRSGMLFYNTLFDENAASHIALGRGYRFCLKEGDSLSEEAFSHNGGNASMVHVDCMIGSEHMDVDGITGDGRHEPVMRKGEWALQPEHKEDSLPERSLLV